MPKLTHTFVFLWLVLSGPPWQANLRGEQTWNCADGKGTSVLWRAAVPMGAGSLAVIGDRVLLGSSNSFSRRHGSQKNAVIMPKTSGGASSDGMMLCLDAGTGEFLWRALHPWIGNRRHAIPGYPISSTACIDGDRVYYVSDRGELVCLDLHGFRDGENDGRVDEETKGPNDADFVWVLDMVRDLGVYLRFPGDVGGIRSSPIVVGDLIYCVTGNGSGMYLQNSAPSPEAPSFLAVRKKTGEVVWSSNAPGKDLIFTQGSTPALFKSSSSTDQMVFPGGDGRLYGFESTKGELLWRVNCNLPIQSSQSSSRFGRKLNFFHGAPLVHQGVVYVGLNQEPELRGPDRDRRTPILAIAVREVEGEWQATRKWTFDADGFRGTLASVTVSGDIVYVLSDPHGLLALDLQTGKEIWRTEIDADSSWFGAPVVHDKKVFFYTLDGIYVFEDGRERRHVGHYDLGNSFSHHARPVIANERLYVATRGFVWCLRLP